MSDDSDHQAEIGDDLPGVLKVAYKPVGIVSGIIGGIVAGQLFALVWKKVSAEPDTPQPLSRDYRTREVLVAATLQGAIFGLVKTAVDRYGAQVYHRAMTRQPTRRAR